MTIDVFAAPLDDPFLVGRIAALNAASDCFAMGSRPIAALATAMIPIGTDRQQEQMLYELLAGALFELGPMGATLAGGHTIEGSPLTIGFSMLAEQIQPPRGKGGLRDGDVLVLTKPLGIGILLAAHMSARCQAEWWEPLLHAMLLSNQHAASLCREFDVQGLTDATGFGMAGHLLEMLRASDRGAEIWLDQVPMLPGVEELLATGLESTLAPANRRVEREMRVAEVDRRDPRYRVLFDPQTSGGLLMGVPEVHARAVVAQLSQHSAVPSAIIGRVMPSTDPAARITIGRRGRT
jgi:selenide,water dikinase